MEYSQAIAQALEAGNLQSAVDTLAANETEHGAEADYAISKAMILMAEGDAAVARAVLVQASNVHYDNGDLWYSLGSICYAEEDFQSAYEAFSVAHQYVKEPDAELEALIEVLKVQLDTAPVPDIAVLTKQEIAKIKFDRSGDTMENIYFLMHRAEFGVEAPKAIAAMRQAVESGRVTKEELLEYAVITPLHAQKLQRIINERL